MKRPSEINFKRLMDIERGIDIVNIIRDKEGRIVKIELGGFFSIVIVALISLLVIFTAFGIGNLLLGIIGPKR